MNDTIKFYKALLKFLSLQRFSATEAVKVMRLLKPCISWKVTDEQLVEISNPEIRFGQNSLAIREEMIRSAFRDLTVIKNPIAMKIFRAIFEGYYYGNPDIFVVWGKKFKQRSDGSAVITLHVSDFLKFERSCMNGMLPTIPRIVRASL